MVFSKLFTVLAAAAVVSAQNNGTCSSFVNATSQADLDKIASCGTFDNSLTISTDAAVLTLNGIQNITGSLTVTDSSDLSSLSAPDLKSVGGNLDLEGLTVLGTLSMPQLTDLGGIKLVTLPALEELQFNSGVENARNILVSDTSLKSLQGLNLSDVDTFDVNNNKYIDDITVGASQISDSLSIAFNADSVNVSLPNLKWVGNATFRYCASIDMPVLEKVNNSLGFVNNTVYGINVDTLQTVGSLTISSNANLRNASFANLTEIGGGFVIANNSRYGKVYGFPKLETVRGAVELEGNLTQASLPKLEEVDGSVRINSDNVFNCSTFDDAHKNGDFHGDKYVCKGKSTTISTTISTHSTKSTSSSASTGSASATSGGSGGNAAAAASGSSDSSSSSSSSSSKKSKNGAAGAPIAAAGTSIMGTLMAALFGLI